MVGSGVEDRCRLADVGLAWDFGGDQRWAAILEEIEGAGRGVEGRGVAIAQPKRADEAQEGLVVDCPRW
jgi:hypothetical protein